MHPVNTEWHTPESLRADADIIERAARRHQSLGLGSAVGLFLDVVARRNRARELQDAVDLRESADHLEASRASTFVATSAQPYGVAA